MSKDPQSLKIVEKNTRGIASIIGRIAVAGLCVTLTMGEFPGTFTSQNTLMFGTERIVVDTVETVECSSAEFNKCDSSYNMSLVYNGVELSAGPTSYQDALNVLSESLHSMFPVPSGNTDTSVELEGELSNQADAVDQDMSALEHTDSTDVTNAADNEFNDYDGPDEVPGPDCSLVENSSIC
jgi:hypothetical protein